MEPLNPINYVGELLAILRTIPPDTPIKVRIDGEDLRPAVTTDGEYDALVCFIWPVD